MKKFVPLFLLPLISNICISATNIDTSIFICPEEENIFGEYINSVAVEPIEFFMYVNGNDYSSHRVNNIVNQFIDELKESNLHQKNTKKFIKLIYKKVHSRFLKKYSIDAYFTDIFKSGEYNCVTASALYSIILSHFNIGYKIMETPQHIYLIADPEVNHILLETTLPKAGFLVYNDKIQQDYINYLSSNKIISDQEIKNNSVNELFNKYFCNDETINTSQLAAIQYFNKGIFSYNKLLYNDALKNFEKAYILYKSDKIKYMLNNTLLAVMNEQNLQKEYDGNLLGKYLNLNINSAIAIQFVNEYLNVVTEELVINHPQIDKYIFFFSEFTKKLNDTININEIQQNYYIHLAYLHYGNYEYTKAQGYINKAYLLNPENIRTKQFIQDIIRKRFFLNDYKKNIDSLDYYFNKYPFMLNDKIFRQFYILCYFYLISDAFNDDNPEKGIKYLTKLGNIIKENDTIEIEKKNIELIFIEVYGYYYRKKKYDKAIYYLEYGLSLAPQSATLQNRYEEIKPLIGY